jgi:hypothetical protein
MHKISANSQSRSDAIGTFKLVAEEEVEMRYGR